MGELQILQINEEYGADLEEDRGIWGSSTDRSEHLVNLFQGDGKPRKN